MWVVSSSQGRGYTRPRRMSTMDCRDRSGAAGRPKKRGSNSKSISSVTGRFHKDSGDFGRWMAVGVFAPMASYSGNLVSGPVFPPQDRLEPDGTMGFDRLVRIPHHSSVSLVFIVFQDCCPAG
ncbi:hypothetical protein J3458_019699 [Metarhizium acridum]|uniref:uncharacterized protein n=1 Tax=Metarhizium acridum TaxID=92637 RepID=UPI001C6C871B|nr:hypothetical protein J3458_019699 [Metarhizium acridum]